MASETVASTSYATLSDRLNPTHPAFDKDFKDAWSKMSRKERAAYTEADRMEIAKRHAVGKAIEYPFPTTVDDHCETDPSAYRDIAHILREICVVYKWSPVTTRIYDPYYCAGRVVEHLSAEGFKDVYNKCEDFYAVAAAGKMPAHDIVVTNPAYSGDHVCRMLEILHRNGKPFCALMPDYVFSKDYYRRILGKMADNMLYLIPNKRYVYWTPKGLREKQQNHSSRLGTRTSPFRSSWYIYVPDADAFRAIQKLRNPAFRIAKEISHSEPLAAVATSSISGHKRRHDFAKSYDSADPKRSRRESPKEATR